MKRLAVLAVALATCTTFLPQGNGAVAAPDRSRPERAVGTYPAMSKTSSSGVIVSGVAPAGATVQAFARLSANLEVGDEITTVELPVTVDDSDSTFEAYADASALPEGFVTDDGFVNVQVFAQNQDGFVWDDHTSVALVTVGTESLWKSPTAASPSKRQLARPGFRRTLSGVPVGRLAKVGAPQQVAAGQKRVDTDPGDEDSKDRCVTVVINSNYIPDELGSVYPIGNTSARLRVMSSDGGSYQVAQKVPNHPLEKLEMQHALGGWGDAAPWTSSSTKYKSSVEYYTVDNHYRNPSDGTCQYYLTYEPHQESGGFTDQSDTRPDFGTCFNILEGSKWYRETSNGTPYSLNAGVEAGALLGVSLEIQKNYSPTSYKYIYDIFGLKKMCGNGGDPPGTASRVMEKWR